MKHFLSLLLFSHVLIVSEVFAGGVEDITKYQFSFLDTAHASVSNQVLYISNKIDSIVGGVNKKYRSSRTQVYMKITTENNQGEKPHVYQSIGARLDLPRTQGRLKLLVSSGLADGNGETSKNISAKPQNKLTQDEEPGAFSTAMQYLVSLNKFWKLDYRTGIDLKDNKLYPFARLYSRQTFRQDVWRERLVGQVYLHTANGSGYETTMDIERNFFSTSLFKLTSKAQWSQETKIIEVSQTANLSYKLMKDVFLIHSLAAIGSYSGSPDLERYAISTQCRYKLHRKWTYLEISPVVNFDRLENFKPRFSIKTSIEVLFGY